MKTSTLSTYAKILVLLVIVCISTTYLYLILFDDVSYNALHKSEILTIDHAFVSFEDGSEKVVYNLPKTFNSDKKLTATYYLPDDFNMKHKGLLITAQFTSFNCFIDSEKVYEYAEPSRGIFYSGGHIRKFISLDDKKTYQQVTITQTTQLTNNNKITVEPLIIGNQLDIFIDALVHRDLFLVVAVFLLFGLFIIMITAKLLFFSRNEYGEILLSIALFYLLYSVFLITQNDSMQYLLSSFSLTLYILQYIVILVAQVPLLFIFKRGFSTKFRHYYNYVILFVICNLIFQVLLIYLTNISFEDVKLLSFISIIFSTFWVFYTYLNTSSSEMPDKNYLMVAFLPITVGSLVLLIVEIFFYHTLFSITINVQLLLFLICQFYYAAHIYSNFANEELKNAEYKRLSLLDFMTGLKNRTAYIQYLEDETVLKKSQWIVFIDLNNLKALNDNYGHDYGDIVIKRMAEVILELCHTCYQCEAFRIGGDEFILFVAATSVDSIDRLLKILVDISDKHSSERVLNLKYSVGYAYYDAAKDNLQDVINTADMHMYREKLANITE